MATSKGRKFDDSKGYCVMKSLPNFYTGIYHRHISLKMKGPPTIDRSETTDQVLTSPAPLNHQDDAWLTYTVDTFFFYHGCLSKPI